MNAYLRNSLALLAFIFVSSSVLAQEVDLSEPPAELADETIAEEGDDITPEEEVELMANEPGIEIAEFEAPKSGGLGLWSASRLGVPYSLWQGIDEKQVLPLLAQIPEAVESPAIRNVRTRVLVMETARSDFSEAVLMARVNALLKMGQAVLATKLLENVPESIASDALRKQLYLLKILSADSNEAVCQQADAQQADKPEAFWQRFQVLCYTLAAETSKAQLSVELLREQNHASESFTQIIQAIIDKKSLEVDVQSLEREELAWVSLAQKLPEELEGLSIETLALVALNGKLKGELAKQVKVQNLNVDSVAAPKDNSPDVPLAFMRLSGDAAMSDVRRALMAAAMRRAWGKPISIEMEEALLARSYRAELNELSVIWQEMATKMQDNEQRLEALFLLLRPMTDELSRYTVGDLNFLVGELKSLGLNHDAAAIAQEALGK
ncbi:MAG: hypothetical protein P8P30_03565 [Rickettsiales bacterium]|nr:hypothetical protein [Rickettsiales bacterium]